MFFSSRSEKKQNKTISWVNITNDSGGFLFYFLVSAVCVCVCVLFAFTNAVWKRKDKVMKKSLGERRGEKRKKTKQKTFFDTHDLFGDVICTASEIKDAVFSFFPHFTLSVVIIQVFESPLFFFFFFDWEFFFYINYPRKKRQRVKS